MMTEAQKRAKQKYDAKTYKMIGAKLRLDEIEYIDNYCKSIGLSKAETIVKAIRYCDENNIDLNKQSR